MQYLDEDTGGSFVDECSKITLLNKIYEKLIAILKHCTSLTVPKHEKDFYKYWWDQELDLLKGESINSHNLWKSSSFINCVFVTVKKTNLKTIRMIFMRL